ncbi:IS110 family transposase [Gemella cuniculi]|uniref:IS110 family transposase n=1 Tax=Gemella cuniculi TaxID=150240 RepID=UPI001B7FB8DE|nr:transposase [Gemella cuniculi]
MLTSVGIDVSKGKSTVAVFRPVGEIVRKPFDVKHTLKELSSLSSYIEKLDGDTRIVRECAGHYRESILKVLSNAGLFVYNVKPHLIKGL